MSLLFACADDEVGIVAGAGMCSDTGPCPPSVASNTNAFASTFGAEVELDTQLFARPVSGYEVASKLVVTPGSMVTRGIACCRH